MKTPCQCLGRRWLSEVGVERPLRFCSLSCVCWRLCMRLAQLVRPRSPVCARQGESGVLVRPRSPVCARRGGEGEVYSGTDVSRLRASAVPGAMLPGVSVGPSSVVVPKCVANVLVVSCLWALCGCGACAASAKSSGGGDPRLRAARLDRRRANHAGVPIAFGHRTD